MHRAQKETTNNNFNLKIKLTNIGKLIEQEIQETNIKRKDIEINKYIIMPDHVHMIIEIKQMGTVHRAPTIEKFKLSTSNTIPTIIRYIKGGVTRKLNKRNKKYLQLWQRNYYEHIIRNEKEYYEICKYMEQNPIRYYFKNI